MEDEVVLLLLYFVSTWGTGRKKIHNSKHNCPGEGSILNADEEESLTHRRLQSGVGSQPDGYGLQQEQTEYRAESAACREQLGVKQYGVAAGQSATAAGRSVPVSISVSVSIEKLRATAAKPQLPGSAAFKRASAATGAIPPGARAEDCDPGRNRH